MKTWIKANYSKQVRPEQKIRKSISGPFDVSMLKQLEADMNYFDEVKIEIKNY